jgi:hypothetical protein
MKKIGIQLGIDSVSTAFGRIWVLEEVVALEVS